jgi:hypothetical protein
MKPKLFHIIVLASVTAASSVALADDGSGIRMVVPMPPPTSRPSEADFSAIADAQKWFDNARKDASAARADLIKAQSDLNRITRSLQTQLDTDGPLADAANAVEAAKATYEELAQPIMASLAELAPYREARVALATAQQAADEVRARPEAGTEERFVAAKAVLDAKATVAQLENAALVNNPDVVNAKTNCLEAAQHLRATRLRLLQAIHQDPAYVAASQAVDDARERSAAADQQLAAAKQDLFASQRRLADKQESRQQILDWTYSHGLPDPP